MKLLIMPWLNLYWAPDYGLKRIRWSATPRIDNAPRYGYTWYARTDNITANLGTVNGLSTAAAQLSGFAVIAPDDSGYENASSRYMFLSNRTSANSGWSWGRFDGGTGVAKQDFTFQGVSELLDTGSPLASGETPMGFIWNGATMVFYANGQQTTSQPATSLSAGTDIVLGAQSSDGVGIGAYWVDRVGIIAMFDRAITARHMLEMHARPYGWIVAPSFERRIYLPAAAGGGTTNEVSASDGLYLLDLRRKEELHQLAEGFLMVDARTSQVSLLGHDKMFLFDQALAQAVRQRYVLDPIYLLDSYSSAQQHVTGDGLYLLDTRVGVQEHTFREGVLLNDYSIKSLLKVLADGLLLFDQVTSSAAQQFSVTVIDGLYLQDYYLRAVLKIIRDAMLLFDQVTAQTTTGQNLYTVTATDFMLLGDSDTRQLLKQVIEFMLLGDSVQRELLRTRIASDQVLLTDLVQRAIGKYGLDSLMLDDASRRLREMLLREGLYLSDSAATALFVIGAEFLTFARLRMVHLLGIRISAVHLLGIRIGVAGWKVMQ